MSDLLKKIKAIAAKEQEFGVEIDDENVEKLGQVAAKQVEILVVKCKVDLGDIRLQESKDGKSFYVHWSSWLKA